MQKLTKGTLRAILKSVAPIKSKNTRVILSASWYGDKLYLANLDFETEKHSQRISVPFKHEPSLETIAEQLSGYFNVRVSEIGLIDRRKEIFK